MKLQVLLVSVLVTTAGFGQNNSTVSMVDSAVASINKNLIAVEKFRWLMGHIEYGTINGQIAKVTYSYKDGPRQVVETFYLQDSCLQYVTKQAESYFFYGDSTVLLGQYYFDKNKLTEHKLFHDEKPSTFSEIQETLHDGFKQVKYIILKHQAKIAGH